MFIETLKSKIHNAVITGKNLNYEGSITIDEELMELAGLKENEWVYVVDINNGNRFQTYVIKGEKGSKVIELNGAAARLVEIGDRVIIMAKAYVQNGEEWKAKVIILNEKNEVVQVK